MTSLAEVNNKYTVGQRDILRLCQLCILHSPHTTALTPCHETDVFSIRGMAYT